MQFDVSSVVIDLQQLIYIVSKDLRSDLDYHALLELDINCIDLKIFFIKKIKYHIGIFIYSNLLKVLKKPNRDYIRV